MRSDKRFKTLLYWIILIGYLVGIYYVWIDFREELRDARKAREEYLLKEDE